MIRTILSKQQWERIAPELPGKPGDPGATARDNRMFVEAVLWIARTGAPWRDLPREFGKWFTVYTRFWRWAQKGVWERSSLYKPRLRSDRLCLVERSGIAVRRGQAAIIFSLVIGMASRKVCIGVLPKHQRP